MSITNLSGTKWKLNNTISPFQQNKSFNINFTRNNSSYSKLNINTNGDVYAQVDGEDVFSGYSIMATATSREEPTTKTYYSIITAVEGNGTATCSSSKVSKTEYGTTTLTAIDAEEAYFTKWILRGEYEVVAGDEYSYELTIRPTSDVMARASFSIEPDYLDMTIDEPGPKEYYDITGGN